MPAFIGMGVMAAGSLFSGIMGGQASKQAAQEYEQALQQAEGELQSQENLGLSKFNPYLNAGQQASGTLSQLLGTPGQGLLTPWTQQFSPLSAAQVQQTPGYQFQLQQGENAMQNSAAAKGSLLTGRTLADLNNYAQGTANSAYQQYGVQDPLLQYQTAYQSFLNNQQNTYSMLAGQQNTGLQAAGGASSLISNMGGDIASLMGQKGAAQAQGTIGQANAYGSILPGIGNSISQYGLLRMLNGQGGANTGGIFSGNGGGFGGSQFLYGTMAARAASTGPFPAAAFLQDRTDNLWAASHLRT